MTDETVEQKIMDYMGKTRFATLTTIGRKSGEPKSTIILYGNNRLDIYFNTGRATEKVKNIAANPVVAIAVHHDDPEAKELTDTRGLLISGRAEPLSDDDLSGVPEGVMMAYNMVNSHYPNASVVFKVAPKKMDFIDYSKGFGHRDIIEF